MTTTPAGLRARVIVSLYTTSEGRPAFHVEIKGKMPHDRALRRALAALWRQVTHLHYQP